MATVTGSVDQPVSDLKKACDDAYTKYSNSCSHAVWHVVTTIVDPKFGWLDANLLVDFLVGSSDWKEVTVDAGWLLAQQGVVVIGGLKKPGGHGHVIVMYPGEKTASGGYLYTYKDKKTGKDKTEPFGATVRIRARSQPRWILARSEARETTVWDPWASDDVFADVDFWTKK